MLIALDWSKLVGGETWDKETTKAGILAEVLCEIWCREAKRKWVQSDKSYLLCNSVKTVDSPGHKGIQKLGVDGLTLPIFPIWFLSMGSNLPFQDAPLKDMWCRNCTHHFDLIPLARTNSQDHALLQAGICIVYLGLCALLKFRVRVPFLKRRKERQADER
jgi:hypothetical protein